MQFQKMLLYCWVSISHSHEINLISITHVGAFSLETEIQNKPSHMSAECIFLLMVFYQLVSLIRKYLYTSHLSLLILGIV